jgi:leucyl aminopeptidase
MGPQTGNASEVYMVGGVVLVSAVTQDPTATVADTVVLLLFEGEQLPDLAPLELGQLLASGEARSAFRALAVAHAAAKRWILLGAGKRTELTAERARILGVAALGRAREISTRLLCVLVSEPKTEICEALVQGVALAGYRFDSHRSTAVEDEHKLEHLIVAAPLAENIQAIEQAVTEAALVSEQVNVARDLQNRPGNDLTPEALAEHAQTLAQELDSLSVEVQGRQGIIERGMGAFAAVTQGSDQEPALITLNYEHPQARGPLLGFVGKAVTFDSGGISLKPSAKMSEMKFDMSGGAAVIQAVAAIARLRLPVRLVAVVGATENLPSSRAVKPGDIVTAANGKTIEVNNTDAEGRLVLADCLWYARSLGAEQLIDLATLTGAVLVALGSTHAGLLSNDEGLARRVMTAGQKTGEIVWRLPLHEEYDELIKGRYGDLNNAPEERKAGTIVGATFLSHFIGEVPWAHLDIAGSAWDLGRAYAPKGASGYGVRLLVELARSYC